MPEKSKEIESKVGSPDKGATASSTEKKRRLHIGLDLGTLQSCFVNKLNKPGSE